MEDTIAFAKKMGYRKIVGVGAHTRDENEVVADLPRYLLREVIRRRVASRVDANGTVPPSGPVATGPPRHDRLNRPSCGGRTERSG